MENVKNKFFCCCLNSCDITHWLKGLQEDFEKRNVYSPSLWKKLTFFYFYFRIQSLLMDKVIKNKMGLELVTSRSSGYETSLQNFIYYIWSDQVWWCNIKRCLSYSKPAPANLCKSIHDIINYPTSICPFECGKCRKEEEKLEKSEYFENKKSFLDEIKNIFRSFWRAIIWSKNKN